MLPRRIVAIGASTTFGRVDPEGGGYIGRLKTWHEGKHRKNCVFNLGISSETSRDFLKRLVPECTPRKPDLIILAAASNDARRVGSPKSPCDVPLPEYRRNLTKLIEDAKKFGDVFVTLMHPVDESRTTPLPYKETYYFITDLERYLDAARSVCKALNVPFLDVYREWTKDKGYKKKLYSDGLHPNASGHRHIFSMLRKKLLKLYS